MRSLQRRVLVVGAVGAVGSAILLAGCTSGTTLGSSGTVTLSAPTTGAQAGRTQTTETSGSRTPAPVTPDGLLVGVGVDDSTITIGLLIDGASDRGFSTGVALWQKAVNVSGGICGRTISTVTNRPGESLIAGYRRIAGTTIGVITLPSPADRAGLAALAVDDQMPTLTAGGSSADLGAYQPVIVGATEDIETINTLDYLRSTGTLVAGHRLGILTDASQDATNALAGARWWAARHGVMVDAHSVADPEHPSWSGVSAVLVIAGPDRVRATLDATPTDVQIVTDLDGYDPTQIPHPAGRLLVSLAAPAYGSDNPGAAAVAKAFVASGRIDPGPELMAGYGVAASWGRLLAQACVARALTHTGVQTAMTTVGPASVDSLFGPSDPGLAAGHALPATRVSSVALADPKAPAGLRPLIWLQAAPGISDYVPGK